MASSARELTVSSAEFVRRFGAWQDRANSDPIFVTHHGRTRHVLLSLSAYNALATTDVAPAGDAGQALRMETLLAVLDSSFIAVDAGYTVVAANPAACVYFGVSSNAILGREIGEELPELTHSVVHAHLARTLASGEIASFELPALRHPGQWLRCQVFPWGDGVGCLLRNISGEHDARTAEQSRQALTEAARVAEGIGFARLSLRGTFEDVNERFAAMAGFAPAALEQVKLTDILPLNRRVEASGQIEAVLCGGLPRGFETALLVNNGGEQAVRVGLAPLRGDYAVDGAMVVLCRTTQNGASVARH